jgi:glucose-6-phosphate dehydrogenase assembly protein OpcA
MLAGEVVARAWEAQDTTVEEIERQLTRIARTLVPPGADPASYPPPRASVLNLIVRAGDEAEAERAAQLVATLATRNPSRTLLLVTDPEAPADRLDAAIHARCAFEPGGTGRLCFEQVRLIARGATALHVDTVVAPLLVANLPVFLWWLGRPPRSRDPLLELCDRLIVDSAAFPDAPAGLAALDAHAAAAEGSLGLGDLGWRRCTPWRQIIAQFFDPPDARPYQRLIRRVTVEYAPTAGGMVSAAPLLLVGWLAACLGWEPEAATGVDGALDLAFAADRYSAAGRRGEIIVRLRPRPRPGAEPGELQAVTLSAASSALGAGMGPAPATFEVRWSDSCTWATTHVVLPGVRELTRTVPLERPSTAVLLARELESPVADPLYAESLALVARLVR